MVEKALVAVVFLGCAAVVAWFALVHTVHQGTRSIPDLSGQSVAEARKMAHDVGLDVTVREPGVFDKDVEIGKVAMQEPHAGFHVKTGSTIAVRLSLGATRAAVPDVRGDSLQGALLRLEQAGLAAGHRAEVRGQASGDSVIATTPQAGTELAPGAAVDLLVNTSPPQEEWVMPSLLALSVERVKQYARAQRLRLGQIHPVDYPGVAAGAVLRQYPAAGSPVGPSDIITVWVSR